MRRPPIIIALQLLAVGMPISSSAFFINKKAPSKHPYTTMVNNKRSLRESVCSASTFPQSQLFLLSSNAYYDHEPPPLDFQELDRRLEALEKILPSALLGFYEPNLKSFAVRPGSKRFSVTSTLFALDCIQHETFSSIADMNMDISSNTRTQKTVSMDGKISVKDVLHATLDSNWSADDLFQVPMVVHTILSVDKDRTLFNDMDRNLLKKVYLLMESILAARPMRRNGHTQPLSDYLIFLCAQAMATIHDSTKTLDRNLNGDLEARTVGVGIGGLPLDALPDGASSQLSLGLSRCAEISLNQLCRQLAYRNAGDGNNFDVMRLAYSLLTYVITTNTLAGTAGIEMVEGEGPIDTVGPANNFLIKQGLKSFFEEQMDDGMWDKGQPIYKSFRRTGRNVGNAFVFATDTVASLLKVLPSEYFRPHMGALEKTLAWIEAHQLEEIIPDYCDPISLKCYGKTLTGWNSPHLTPENSPQAWSTAQTASCLIQMRRVVRELMHDDVLSEFRGLKNNNGPSMAAWDRLLDTDIGDPTRGCDTLKNVMDDRVLTPFANGVSSPSFGASYSCILFGPPGTAKTTICEALAERMGWDFVVIDTSVFLADGLSNVASRIRYVFDRLMQLEETVILFDEIEEFCLDRETPGLGMESRMLTTAMLTAINDLRRRKRSVFFLATNRLRAFDSAITRPGRFDLQLFVGTPNLDAKCIMLVNKLSLGGFDEDVKQTALAVYREFLTERWTDDVMFMNYLEGLQFASSCADLLAREGELKKESMEHILSKQANVMTVRGSARDEYVTSMELSRL